MNTLFLRLEGPLQSWGLRSQWGIRETSNAPSKSGLLGLLGCAMGLRRDNPELVHLSRALRLGVRIDRPGTLLRDYHTTGGGSFGGQRHYGGSRFHDEPYAGGVLSAEVLKKRIKVKVNATTKEPETDTSERYYLADASFLAALQGDAALIERCAKAVQTPYWPLFLGRKSCVPSQPIYQGLGQFADLKQALQSQARPERSSTGSIRMLIEAKPGQGNRQNDNLGNAAQRVFEPRFVSEIWWPEADQAETPINTLEG